MRFSLLDKFLCILFLFIFLLIATRVVYSGSSMYGFLIWNLFLAWIPCALSGYFKVYRNKQTWKQVFLFSSWLLFFPNALYIITDLIHLKHNTVVPVWYDAILVFTSSFAGLILAFISLQRAEHYLRTIFSKRSVSIITGCIIFLGGFGVYLGRFLRWNSWNIINSPLALAEDIFTLIIYPQHNIKAWVVTVILSALYGLLYYFIKILPGIIKLTNNK